MHLVRRELRVLTVTDYAGFLGQRSVRIGRIRHVSHDLSMRLGCVTVVAGKTRHPRRLLLPRVSLSVTLGAVPDILRENDLAERRFRRIGVDLF